ncbi:MAG: GntR family transcriptional regulator [Firmicutes bacterium]|nr:GntR family transcriptional regulator [Bacillota bacterium]
MYEILLDGIITFKITPGTKLIEYQLAEQFGISRSPIREAILQLEEQGFVTKELYKTVVVEPFDIAEYNELIEFRCLLEPAATGMASLLMTDDDMKQLKEYADRIDEMCKDGDFSLLSEYENLFHEFIIQSCHNRYIINAYKNIQPYLTRSRAAYLYVNKDLTPQLCVEEHSLIYNSLLLKNKELAEHIVHQLLKMLLMPSVRRSKNYAAGDHPYEQILKQEKSLLIQLTELHQRNT